MPLGGQGPAYAAEPAEFIAWVEPAGTFPAVLFRVNCEGKVGPAHTHNTGYNFFAPGVGMVAMILEEDVTAFWLFNIDSTTGKVLMSK